MFDIEKIVTRAEKRLRLGVLTSPLIVCASLYDRKNAAPLPFHHWDPFEFHYVHEGSLTWQLADGSCLRVRGGDVAIIQPNTPHRSTDDIDAPAVFLVFCIDPAAFSPSPPFISAPEQEAALRILRNAGNRVCRGLPAMDEVFRGLHQEAWRIANANGAAATSRSRNPLRGAFAFDRTAAGEAYLRNLLHRAFLFMLRSVADAPRTPHYTSVKRALTYVDKHLADNPSPRNMARAASLSVVRLRQLFHAEVGETPAKYVLRRRLERAKHLLRNPGRSITDIANELGFSSSQNFAHSFRAYFSHTPTAWRRQAQHGPSGENQAETPQRMAEETHMACASPIVHRNRRP